MLNRMSQREHASKDARGFWAYDQPAIDAAVSHAVKTTMCEAARVSGMAVSTVRYFMIRAGHAPKRAGRPTRKRLSVIQ